MTHTHTLHLLGRKRRVLGYDTTVNVENTSNIKVEDFVTFDRNDV